MNNMKIRKAKKEDCPRLVELLVYINSLHYNNRKDIFPCKPKYDVEELEKLIENPSYIIVVVQSGSYVIGYLISKLFVRENNSRVIYVDDLCVDEMYQDLGAGKALMDYIKQYSKFNEVDRIELNVWSFNKHAIEFYESLGYKVQKLGMEIALKD